jgi:hypothetical protein
MRLRVCQPRNGRIDSAGSLLLFAALALPVLACQPHGSPGVAESSGVVLLALGATQAEARKGGTSSFVLESTPDLALHADLRDASYDGKTLLIRGTDPQGQVLWSYPHVQRGASFDAVLPVFGSAAARKHIVGTYAFEVLAPDRTVLAAGSASFRSTRGDGGAASYRVDSAGDAVVAARRE